LLVGSYAIGKADAESDLDFCVITTDEAFGDFLATRADFIRRLDEPLFLDDFGSGIFMLSILSNGTEAELVVGHESQLKNFFSGPYRVLIDKQHLLDEAVPLHQEARNEPEQLIILRQQIAWFWHDMVHFITAMHRGQWWWAYGQLEALRAYCVNLTRLQHNFSDPMAGGETYFKIDDSVPTDPPALPGIGTAPGTGT
jgi:hypothetical protein